MLISHDFECDDDGSVRITALQLPSLLTLIIDGNVGVAVFDLWLQWLMIQTPRRRRRDHRVAVSLMVCIAMHWR